jgi:hypothetical protein
VLTPVTYARGPFRGFLTAAEYAATDEGTNQVKLNIDTTGVQFFCTKEAEARTDRETGAPRVDRETGEPQWQVQVAALDSTGGEVLRVTVNGRPDVAVGCPVAIEGLVAIPWSQGDRSGVAFRASSIRSMGSPIAGVVAPSSAETPPSKRAA